MNINGKAEAIEQMLQSNYEVSESDFNLCKQVSHVSSPTVLLTPQTGGYDLQRIEQTIESEYDNLSANVEELYGHEYNTIKVT